MYDVIIVGAGLSGAVFADQFARVLGKRVLVLDKRNHIAGNCYDERNEDGILMNEYGLHLFHCNDERTYNYIQQFSEWIRYDHKVLSRVHHQGRDIYVPLPVNIETVNQLCDQSIQTTEEMNQWLSEHQVKYDAITNGEEAAKARVGTQLFETLFEHYTYKQWAKTPAELDKSVLQRIPIRMDHDVRYFSDKYQVIPANGYTEFVRAMLDHPLITVQLNTDFTKVRNESWCTQREWLIYTGPIDVYFKDLPPLEYRSIRFEKERLSDVGLYQCNSVINEPGKDVEYTRTVEYKHLPYNDRKSPHTTIVREYTMAEGEPYYPIPNQRNLDLYQEYLKQAVEEEKNNVIFVGRLANYKYKNMNEAILDALVLFDERVFLTKE